MINTCTKFEFNPSTSFGSYARHRHNLLHGARSTTDIKPWHKHTTGELKMAESVTQWFNSMFEFQVALCTSVYYGPSNVHRNHSGIRNNNISASLHFQKVAVAQNGVALLTLVYPIPS